jgi:hypothetical protein
MRRLAIPAGAVLLAWPALLNGYPLVFIDTVSYLNHTTVPETPWDKTQVYGPLLHLFHWRVSLWPAVAAQALAASALLWLVQRMLRGEARPLTHLGACAAAGSLTTAPWFLATLMPDALTGLVPPCLLLLAFGRLSRGETACVALGGALAIAAHLSHLPTAVALVAVVAVVARQARPVLRAALPVGLALLVLAGSNLAAFGQATLSPHGAVFLLARLQADGPAADVIRDRCPASGWHLCAFADRLPMDSDEFLWDGTSPLNRNADGSPRPMGGAAGAAEARAIVAATLATHPMEVAAAMAANTLRQLGLVAVGDTLVNDHLAASARRPIAASFPARELDAFDAGAQMRGVLPDRAAPFLWPHLPVLIAAALGAPWLLWRAWRAGDAARAALLAGALVALVANAGATGALSKPHHRYEARIAWILPVAVLFAAMPGGLSPSAAKQPRPARRYRASGSGAAAPLRRR